jgi:heat shock protein HslJ
MRNVRSFVGLVLFATLPIACSESFSTPTSPTSSSSASGSASLTADQLAGTWTLSSIQPAGQAEQATPAGASYTLTFADGRLSTRVDCNTCNGAFALSGQTLTAGPALACTRAACPTMAFENTYTSMLSSDSTVTQSGSTLVLSSARGVLRFTR